MYEAEKNRLYSLIEQRTGIDRPHNRRLETLADLLALRLRREVGLDDFSNPITHDIEFLTYNTFPMQGTYKGVWENLAWNRGYADPLQAVVDAWDASPHHHDNMFRAEAKFVGLGIYTELPAGSTNGEWDRRWYFSNIFTKELIVKAVIVNKDSAVDQAAAATLTAKVGGFLLLTEANRLTPSTHDALVALAPDRILVVGGPGVVGDNVKAALAAIAPTDRIGGENRFETAITIANYRG